MAKVNPKGLRDVVLNFGKSLAAEGSEEAMTEAANIVADAIIMGDVSDSKQSGPGRGSQWLIGSM